jgi:Zn finger protein HypA/HybF involved in hydrogenase expression
MTEYLANDYASIGRKLKLLEDAKEGRCISCDFAGWVYDFNRHRYLLCPICHNKFGNLSPTERQD